MRVPTRTSALLLVLALACSRKPVDPFDTAAIERDIKERPVRELYEEAAKLSWTPPEDGLLTDSRIEEFLQVAALSNRIAEVADARFDKQVEGAAREDDRFARMGTAFAAYGTARVGVTSHLRAALTLGKNPHQHHWVADQIYLASQVVLAKRRHDQSVRQAEAEFDDEDDQYLREGKMQVLTAQLASRDRWREEQGDVALANSELVEKHAGRLAEHIASLRVVDPANP